MIKITFSALQKQFSHKHCFAHCPLLPENAKRVRLKVW